MDEHDKIVFPVLFRKMLLSKLNEALNTDESPLDFKEGKYESIWEGEHRKFITFELKKFPGIKLTIELGREKEMVFMADFNIQQLDGFRYYAYKGVFRRRFYSQKNHALNKPIDNDKDQTPSPDLDFSSEKSMEEFRTKRRNFPDILARRVLHNLNEWEQDGIGIREFLEKHLGQGES
jgi:hypothetical protein